MDEEIVCEDMKIFFNVQGERRFFRVICRWLAENHTLEMARNINYVPEFGRWDDLYVFVGTPLESRAMQMLKKQILLDLDCKTPSLCAKWLKSENTSSKESRELARKTMKAFGVSPHTYRMILSRLRKRINVLERLMSAGKWDEIEFDKIPSKAGMIYRNAFARHDVERMKSEKNVRTYEDFMKDTDTKVNAKALYPYEVVAKAVKWNHQSYSYMRRSPSETERNVINKYWDNLEDYFKGASLDALCVCDTSGSMTWDENKAVLPINVAISIALYCAEKARGPFHGHYISFSSCPRLVETVGVDFVDKVRRIYETNLCENTNIEATFDMILNTVITGHVRQSDLPKSIIVVSDMEFDQARGYHSRETNTLMENIKRKWEQHGYKMPNLVFWNVNARHDNVPMKVKNGVTLVSGFSPVLFEQIMKGKTGYDLMMDKLNEVRYECIH